MKCGLKLYSVEKCGCSTENGIVGISSYPYPAEGEAQQSTMFSRQFKNERKVNERKKTGYGMNWIEWIIYDVVLENHAINNVESHL